MVDATWQRVSNEAGLVAASARISWPLARSYLAVSVQHLVAADIEAPARPDWPAPDVDQHLCGGPRRARTCS